MSTTTPSPIGSAADRTCPPAATTRPVGRLVGPIALVVGAAMGAAGMGMHLPAMEEDVSLAVAIAEDQQWLASHLLLGFGFAIVALGAATALPLVRGRGTRFAAVGAVLTALGAAVLALSDLSHGALGFALADQVEPATSLAIHQAYFEHPAILLLNTGPMLLTVGMILLGTGLLRSRVLPRWVGAAIVVSPLAVHAALNLELPTYLHGAPILVGMTAFAYALASSRSSRAEDR